MVNKKYHMVYINRQSGPRQIVPDAKNYIYARWRGVNKIFAFYLHFFIQFPSYYLSLWNSCICLKSVLYTYSGILSDWRDVLRLYDYVLVIPY